MDKVYCKYTLAPNCKYTLAPKFEAKMYFSPKLPTWMLIVRNS